MKIAIVLLVIIVVLLLEMRAQAEEGASTQKPAQKAVVDGGNAFGLDLYGKLAEKEGNLFCSPESIHTALAMAYAGAGGATADQMARTLHFTLPRKELDSAFAALIKAFNSPHTWNDKPSYELVIANAIWGQRGYPFKAAFTGLLKNDYQSELNPTDFTRVEEARKAINDWAARQTKDKIKDIIPPGAINDATRLILTNAIYFKSNWAHKFLKEATKDEPFMPSAGKSEDVPMMHQKHEYPYAETDDFQAVEMPYIGGELSMLFFLPKKVDGLPAFEKTLTAGNLAKWSKEFQGADVVLTLPKFTFSSSFSLGDPLKEMGMADAFSAKADFSGMTDKEKLFIQAVLHKAFVAVDAEGTEAAAVTAVAMAGAAMRQPKPPKVFTADHPFVFMIRHNATGSILFLGRVADPR